MLCENWGAYMQTKEEKLLKEKIKSMQGIEKLTYKDIEDILKELQRKALPRK